MTIALARRRAGETIRYGAAAAPVGMPSGLCKLHACIILYGTATTAGHRSSHRATVVHRAGCGGGWGGVDQRSRVRGPRRPEPTGADPSRRRQWTRLFGRRYRQTDGARGPRRLVCIYSDAVILLPVARTPAHAPRTLRAAQSTTTRTRRRAAARAQARVCGHSGTRGHRLRTRDARRPLARSFVRHNVRIRANTSLLLLFFNFFFIVLRFATIILLMVFFFFHTQVHFYTTVRPKDVYRVLFRL